jgi:hypothetical protein
MNSATYKIDGNAKVLVLYMALEPSNRIGRPALSEGATRRKVTAPAAVLLRHLKR